MLGIKINVCFEMETPIIFEKLFSKTILPPPTKSLLMKCIKETSVGRTFS